MVWIAFASMTAAAVLCVVWPLLRQRSAVRAGAMPDVGFYRQQIAELDEDVARGMLPAADASGTRVELGRRLLSAAERSDVESAGPMRRGRHVVALLAAVLVPALTLGLYLKIGSPRYGDLPLAERALPQGNILALIERVETHLASHPDDYRGYELIAPVYMQMGRFNDAAHAYGEMLRIKGHTPEHDAEYGQALVMAADGVVTQQARAAFDAALKTDPKQPQSRFFTGLAAEQDGDKAKARAIWQKLADEAPPGASWLDMVHRRIAGLDGNGPAGTAVAPAAVSPPPKAPGAGAAMPGPPAGPMASAIASMPAEQQQAAIRGMVEGLAARLAENGHDPEGWLRLVRAYTVLGDVGKARQALSDARHAMTGDEATLGRLDGLAHELGLEG
ncbi:MAG TPA: c-type cytochrome biogenesis protein CcmI [Lichenihabitans sp.]|jgi:cytochrome c-type biogenesis protein CcmH|nr:c-type cytochrome biogenesis protein CcmI [Lichenihabitans sp.]